MKNLFIFLCLTKLFLKGKYQKNLSDKQTFFFNLILTFVARIKIGSQNFLLFKIIWENKRYTNPLDP